MQVYRTDLLENALASICESLEGVEGAVIVSVEGFVVASYPPSSEGFDEGPTSSPQVAAMAATMIALGERTLSRLAQGEMERLLIEGSGGGMIVVPASKRASVAVMVNKEAKMGYTINVVRFASKEIAEILEGEYTV